MDSIHSAAKDLIATKGMLVTSDSCREVFRSIGADVSDEGMVKVPEHLVEESLKSIDRKKAYKIYARNPKYDITLGKGLYAHLGEGGTFVIDLETGNRRTPVVKDIEKFGRLSDYLSNISTVIANVVAVDVHPKFRGLHMAKALFENTSKPCSVGMIQGTEKYYYEMAMAVAGGPEELKKRPIVRGSANLRRMSQICEAANMGLPIDLDVFGCGDSMPSSGGTSPVTLAGTLVLSVSRSLMRIILTQSVKPGASMRALIRASNLDLKTGTFCAGSPEMGMLAAAAAQIFKGYYGIPVDAGWSSGDSKVMDEQMGYEKMMVWLLAGLAGVDQVSGMSLIEAGLTASYAQLVIDDELIGMVKRVIDGIKVDKDHLALDLIKKVGPGGLFTGERHTLKYVREEHFQPKITDRRSRSVWEERGSKDIITRATETAKEILRSHEPDPLSSDIQKELTAIIRRAEKEYALSPEKFLVPEPDRIV
jgi:trimethylamine--corrinoid protein Co-methyltransferase